VSELCSTIGSCSALASEFMGTLVGMDQIQNHVKFRLLSDVLFVSWAHFSHFFALVLDSILKD
jgi:hypothetical protein